MSITKISNLPQPTTLTTDKKNTLLVGLNTETGFTQKISLDTIANQLYLTNPIIAAVNVSVGSITSATASRFPNTTVIVSNTPTGIQKNEPHNIGLISEGVAHQSNPNIYGIGVYGVGYTSATTRSGGIVGEAHVSAATDVGSAIGVRGYANDTHTGGHNIGLYGDATGASGSGSNYALYMNRGDIYTSNTQNWILNANLTFTGSTIQYSNTQFIANGNSSILVKGSGSIGYTTGSGGTIAQATSKSTTVILNKSAGLISTNAASLAASTIVSFTLTNSTIGLGDVLILNHVSGGTIGAYTLNAQAASGSASINIRNATAGALAETINVAFVVIKGATS
jgi:hypothetical protein